MGRGPEVSKISGIGKAMKRGFELETAVGIMGVALGFGYLAVALAALGAFHRGVIWAVEKGYLGQGSKVKGA